MTSAQPPFRPEPSDQYQIREVTFYHDGVPYSIPIPFELTEDITSRWGPDVGQVPPPLGTPVVTLDLDTNGTTPRNDGTQIGDLVSNYSNWISGGDEEDDEPDFLIDDSAFNDDDGAGTDFWIQRTDATDDAQDEEVPPTSSWGSFTFVDDSDDEPEDDALSFAITSTSDLSMQSDTVMVTSFHNDEDDKEQDQFLSAPSFEVSEYVPEVSEPETPPLPPLELNPAMIRASLADEQHIVDVSDLDDLNFDVPEDLNLTENFTPGAPVHPSAESATLRRKRSLPSAFIQRPPIKTQQASHDSEPSTDYSASPDPATDDTESEDAPPAKLNLKLLIVPLVLGVAILSLFGYVLFAGSSPTSKTVHSSPTTVVVKSRSGHTPTTQKTPSTTVAVSSMKNFCTAARQYPTISLTPSTPPAQLQQQMTTAQSATAAMLAASPASTKTMATTINTSIDALASILASVQWHYSQITSAQVSQVEQLSSQLNTAVGSLNTILAKC